MAISAGVEGTFRLGDVFSKAFSVFGRHIVAFFLPAVLANLPAYVVRLAVAQLAAPGRGLPLQPNLGGSPACEGDRGRN